MKVLTRFCIPFLLILCFKVPTYGQYTDKAWKNGWKLVFFDEFDSNSLDLHKWKNAYSWWHCLNDNKVYFTDTGNLSFQNGRMIITAKKEKLHGYCDRWDSANNYKPHYYDYDYTSGLIVSKKTFKYGYFECSFKVPEGKNFNSAFWLLGAKNYEIDVFEILGDNTRNADMTLHWKGADPATGKHMSVNKYKLKNTKFSQVYHTMASEWSKDKVIWYVDDKPVPLTSRSVRLMSKHIPDVDMNIIVDLGFDFMNGKVDQNTPFPSDFSIDYIRAYNHDATEKPVITSQKTIVCPLNKPVEIRPSDLYVNDHYHLYPNGFKIVYTDSGGTKTFTGADYTGNKEVVRTIPVKISDGIDESPVFNVRVLISDSNYHQEKFPSTFEIITNPDSLTVTILSKNGEFDFDNIFLVNDKLKITNYHVEREDNKFIIKGDDKMNGKFFLMIVVYKQVFSYPVIF